MGLIGARTKRTDDELKSVALRRVQQWEKWGDAEKHPVLMCVILGEEIGELCKAVLETKEGSGLDLIDVRTEEAP